MKLILAQSSIRILLVAGLALASLSIPPQQVEAQILDQVRKARTDYEESNLIQYAPDDPTTRSRLFTLQTGHAGAFYNCDGEECKRNSPYICWKNASRDRWHRTFSDVMHWNRDKNRIAQRICDGGCCGCKTATPSVNNSCGCNACAGGDGTVTLLSKGAAKTPRRMAAKHNLQLRPKANVAGLVKSGVVKVTPVAKITGAQSVLSETVGCDCAACRAKQQIPKSPVTEAPIAKLRTASLLDRARSSRNR